MSRCKPILVLAVLAILALPASALAKPHPRGFNQTFPVASHLCMKVANGHAPKKLRASSGQVTAACGALRTSYTDAVNTFGSTVTPLRQQAVQAVKALRATCRQARQNHDRAACRTARQQTRTTIRGLRQQVRTAGKDYRTTVQAARKTFWSTIHALRGGSAIKPDSGDTPAPPAGVPSDTAVTQAAA
jgi:hypothetical protein